MFCTCIRVYCILNRKDLYKNDSLKNLCSHFLCSIILLSTGRSFTIDLVISFLGTYLKTPKPQLERMYAYLCS